MTVYTHPRMNQIFCFWVYGNASHNISVSPKPRHRIYEKKLKPWRSEEAAREMGVIRAQTSIGKTYVLFHSHL